MLLLGCVVPELPPEERLDAALPGLAAAVARYTDDPGPSADLVGEADPSLVGLLLPAAPVELTYDTTGESAEVDLLSAGVRLDGARLSGVVSGRGVAEGGGWLLLDTRGGPSPDLHLGFGDGWILASKMEAWSYGPATALAGSSVLDGDTVRFDVDLAGQLVPGHAGAVSAVVKGATVWDHGPAGALGTPEPHAVALLVALAADPAALDDADLAVATALAFGAWRGLVAPEVVPVVEEDALAWFRYGLALDPWLEQQGAAWRLGDQPAAAKLLWAWPGGESAVAGAHAVARQEEQLSLARYRFDVTDADTLLALRDALPMATSAWDAAALRDDAIWADLRYRASADGMRALCEARNIRSNTCAAWKREAADGFDLGEVDGVRVPTDLGVSAPFQLAVEEEHGEFVGDCGVATVLAMASWQAIGLVPLSMGYAGPSFEWPTHNFPLYLEGERFLSPQLTPSARWHGHDTFVYATIPVLDPRVSLGSEPGGWARGAPVAGGRMTYGALARTIDAGVPLSTAFGWVTDAREGAWPEVR